MVVLFLHVCSSSAWKPFLLQTQWHSLLLNTEQRCFTCFEMAANQQRTADTISWLKNKFMAFFWPRNLSHINANILSESTESLPQIGLHLTEQCYGAAPCSYMLAGSEGKWGAVQGPGGSAPQGLFLNCNGFCLQYSEFRAFKWGCCVGAQRDGNSSAVVTVLGEMGGWQCYQEGWCLFPDTFMEFLTIV